MGGRTVVKNKKRGVSIFFPSLQDGLVTMTPVFFGLNPVLPLENSKHIH